MSMDVDADKQLGDVSRIHRPRGRDRRSDQLSTARLPELECDLVENSADLETCGIVEQVCALGRTHKTWATCKRLVVVEVYPV